MSFGSFRTIWITLRAANYTTQAFNSTIKGLSKLQQEQLRLKMDASKNILAVGTMYLALGMIATRTITSIMSKSELGQQVLTRFGENTSKSMAKLGDSLARVVGPILDVIARILELATANPIIRDLLAIFMVLGTTILIVAGVVKMFTGAMGILTVMWSFHNVHATSAQMTLTAYSATAKVATASTVSLGMALGLVTAGFSVFMILGQVIGSNAGAIVAAITSITLAILALAVALNVLSVGTLTPLQLAAFAAGAGMAAGVMAIQSQQPTYKIGTRMLTQTGPITGHAGEIVWNPTNQLPTQVNNDVTGRGIPKKTEFNVTISTGDIHTKADKEELRPFILKTIRDAVDNKD